jgi:hypothetical protein
MDRTAFSTDDCDAVLRTYYEIPTTDEPLGDLRAPHLIAQLADPYPSGAPHS